jgi:endonuclease YncB( thermonuclease family)
VSKYIPPAPYPRTCTVTEVVDGDTLHVIADPGLDLSVKMTLRLYGINTPELPTPEGLAAKGFVEAWVLSNGPLFILLTVKDKREKYGRYLADLMPLGGVDTLCQELLANHFAVVYLP